MVKLEGWVEIKVLFRQGRAIRDIARTVGVSRNTVRKYLRGTNPPHLTRTIRRAHKLDPYKPFLSERLQVAFPLRLPATAVYGELQARGYDGGISRLRDYLRSLKPAPIEDPVVRFETAPGHQLQVDWLVVRRREEPLSAFVATLSYSRASYVEFVTDERLETLMACHARAFEHFGGVPAEVLYDFRNRSHS